GRSEQIGRLEDVGAAAERLAYPPEVPEKGDVVARWTGQRVRQARGERPADEDRERRECPGRGRRAARRRRHYLKSRGNAPSIIAVFQANQASTIAFCFRSSARTRS